MKALLLQILLSRAMDIAYETWLKKKDEITTPEQLEEYIGNADQQRADLMAEWNSLGE